MALAETMLVAPTHIYLGADGKPRIEGSGMKVSFIARYLKQRLTAGQIKEAHPQLSLAQIYAAFSYYYDHQKEFDALLAEQDRSAEEILREIGEQPWRQELAERLRTAQTP